MRPRADLQLVRGDAVPVTAPPCCAHERRAEALEAALKQARAEHAQAEGRRMELLTRLRGTQLVAAERRAFHGFSTFAVFGVGVLAGAVWVLALVWWLS